MRPPRRSGARERREPPQDRRPWQQVSAETLGPWALRNAARARDVFTLSGAGLHAYTALLECTAAAGLDPDADHVESLQRRTDEQIWALAAEISAVSAQVPGWEPGPG